MTLRLGFQMWLVRHTVKRLLTAAMQIVHSLHCNTDCLLSRYPVAQSSKPCCALTTNAIMIQSCASGTEGGYAALMTVALSKCNAFELSTCMMS